MVQQVNMVEMCHSFFRSGRCAITLSVFMAAQVYADIKRAENV
jgi:hypothetical protein